LRGRRKRRGGEPSAHRGDGSARVKLPNKANPQTVRPFSGAAAQVVAAVQAVRVMPKVREEPRRARSASMPVVATGARLSATRPNSGSRRSGLGSRVHDVARAPAPSGGPRASTEPRGRSSPFGWRCVVPGVCSDAFGHRGRRLSGQLLQTTFLLYTYGRPGQRRTCREAGAQSPRALYEVKGSRVAEGRLPVALSGFS
jgi:hypothetical protein